MSIKYLITRAQKLPVFISKLNLNFLTVKKTTKINWSKKINKSTFRTLFWVIHQPFTYLLLPSTFISQNISQFIKKKKEKQISTFVEEQPLHGLDLPIPQQDCATQRVVQNQQEGQHGICAEIHERVALDSVKPEVQHDKVAVATAAAASPTCRKWPRDLHPCEGVVGQVHLLQWRQKEEPRFR